MSLANRNSLAPWMPDSIQYYSHQVDGIRRMADMRSVLLADEMGLGKTLQTLTVFAIDVKRRYTEYGGESIYGETLLIICPASLQRNWLEEIEKFTTFRAEILSGNKVQRLQQMEAFRLITGPKILIANYEKLVIHQRELDAMRFHMIAFDEGHRMKNMKSKTSKACLAVSSSRSIVLTGSPLLNQVNELYAILERITPGQWGSYYKFVQRYCVFGGYEGRQIVGPKNTQELNTRLQAVMIRRLKKDVLDLPDVQYIDRIAELHPRQRTLYRQVVEEMRLDNPDGTISDVENALTKFLRLKQICGTTATVADDDHSDKLDIATEDAKLLLSSGHRVIAFTQFRGVLEAYKRRMEHSPVKSESYPVYVLHGDVPQEPDGRVASDPNKKWSRQEIIHQWEQNPKPGIIIAMYQVAGVGLNMTAARHGQLLDKLFVPALNQQAVDRMHRIGASTTQPVQIFQYLCKNTVENRVETILRTKKRIFDTVVEETSFTRQLMQELLKEEVQT